MTTTLIILAALVVLAAAVIAFRVGHDWTMAAIRRGAKWSMTYPELVEFDRLMRLALKKRGGDE